MAALAGARRSEWLDEVVAWLPEGFDPNAFSTESANDRLTVVDGIRRIQERLGELPTAVADLFNRMHRGGRTFLSRLIEHARLDEPTTVDEATVIAMMRRYLLLLELVGTDGVALTSAGYLPPRMVKRLFDDLEMDDQWMGTGIRESDTIPVLNLRESAQLLGLLRKKHGKLLLTRAGQRALNDPYAVWQHVAQRLPLGRDQVEQDGSWLVLLHVAAGDQCGRVVFPAVADELASLGWRTRTGELDEWVAGRMAQLTWDVLGQVGAVIPPLKRSAQHVISAAGRDLAHAALTR